MDDKRPESELPKPESLEPSADNDDEEITAELVAYLDGELDQHGHERVATKISLDAGVRSEADALKKTWDLLDYLPRPEPSANFTERTVEKIEPLRQSGATGSINGAAPAKSDSAPVVSRSARSAPVAAPSAALTTAPPRSRFARLGRGAVFLLILGCAGLAGYLVRGLAVERLHQVRSAGTGRQDPFGAAVAREPAPLPVRRRFEVPGRPGQSRSIRRGTGRPHQRGRSMKAIGMLTLFLGMLGVALAAGSTAPDDVGFLRSQYALLQSLPPARQQQLRELDNGLHELDKEQQDRLRKVMDGYNCWLAQLSEKDRKRVVEAATAEERLEIIRKLKDREWLETLPKAYRDKYAKTEKGPDRLRLIELWREEQHERRLEWAYVRRSWDDIWEAIKNDKLPPQFTVEFRDQIDAYARNLESQLPPSESERLRKAREKMQEDRTLFRYLGILVEFAQFPLLPGKSDGIVRKFEDLPILDREAIFAHRKKGVKDPAKAAPPKDLQAPNAPVGRWPDYAIAVMEYCQQHRFAMPVPLGPTKKAEMPADLEAFISQKLEPALLKAEKGRDVEAARRDQARLKEAEGKWPDYPRAVMDLARHYKLYMPGWMLPGDPKVWERFRPKPAKK